MASAAISFDTGSFPLSKFYGPLAQNKYKYLCIFSYQPYESLGTLLSENSMASTEYMDVRNAISSPFTETICSSNKRLFESTFLAGDVPGGSPMGSAPLTIATTIILTTQGINSWWNNYQPITIDGTGTAFTMNITDPYVDFEAMLFPNKFYVDGGEGFATADRYTEIAPGQILFEGVNPTLTPSASRNVKVWGITMATVDEWTGGTWLTGSPAQIRFAISNEITEVAY